MAKYYRIVTIKSEIVDEEGHILKTEVKKRVLDLDVIVDMPTKPYRVSPYMNSKEFFNLCYSTENTKTKYDELYLPERIKQAYFEEKGLPYVR